MLVFDLDPGPPAGIVECCEVAIVLRGMFEALGLQTLVKTSGSKGMQVYLPLNIEVGYESDQAVCPPRGRAAGGSGWPELVVSRMTKRLRPGKVLVDWSQNDVHKTTVNVYSVRARERPTVSAPVGWDEVQAARAAGDGERLVFDTAQVLGRVERDGDLFAPLLSLTQQLPDLGAGGRGIPVRGGLLFYAG